MKLPLELLAVFVVGLLFGYAIGYTTLPKPVSIQPSIDIPSTTHATASPENKEIKSVATEQVERLKKTIESLYRSLLRMNGVEGTVRIKNFEKKNYLRFSVEINTGDRVQILHVVADENGNYIYPMEVPLRSQIQEFKEPPKSDRPKVELFVMSYCPFGVQMEKGFIPVLRLLGKKIDFELKFVNYAMHGEKEVWENVRQYCIQKLYPDKLVDYLECFDIKQPKDWEGCMRSVGISVNEINKCIEEVDEEYGITAILADKNSWNGPFPPFPIHDTDNKKYGVRGSPTLIINGTEVRVSRSPESIKEAICNAFNNPPPECSQKLSEEVPSPGFGSGAGGVQASCG